MRFVSKFNFGLMLITLAACGRFTKTKTEKPDPTNAQFLSLSNIQNAPAAIQEASKSVVRIDTNGSGGSGSFISDDGLLLTNDHVLGSDVCPKSGCYVSLAWHLQVGEKPEYKKTFVVPKAVAPFLDVAILQVYNIDENTGKSADKLRVSSFLDFARETPESLVGKTIFTVGHPSLGLKKWSVGEVYETQGNWFSSDAFSLPGNSGSPQLNESGKIVGILHRASDSHENITQYGIWHKSIGTSSAFILEVFEKVKNEDSTSLVMLTDVEQVVSAETFLAHSDMFLRAHLEEVSVEKSINVVEKNSKDTKVHPSSLLAEYVDSELESSDSLKSPEDAKKFAQKAENLIDWLDCQKKSVWNAYKTCPADDAQKTWLDRFINVFDKIKSVTGERRFFWVAESAYVLAADDLSGSEAATQAILQNADGQLDFNTARTLSHYLVGREVPKVGGKDIREFLLNFKSVPHHERHFTAIVSGLVALYSRGLISEADLESRLNAIVNDTKITLGERIYAELNAYRHGVLR